MVDQFDPNGKASFLSASVPDNGERHTSGWRRQLRAQQRRKTRATKKTYYERTYYDGEIEERGGGGAEAKVVTEAKTEAAQGPMEREEKRKEARRREQKRREEKSRVRGFWRQSRERVGARFTTMQLDRAFTSFLFERVSTYRNGVRYSDAERRDRLPHRQVETESYAKREEKVNRPCLPRGPRSSGRGGTRRLA